MKERIRILSVLLLVLAASALLVSCRSAEQKVLFKVGDYPITVEEYRYFYYNCQAQDADASQEQLHEQALSLLRQKYAVRKMADDRHVKLSDEDKSAVEEQYRSYVDYYGSQEAFDAMLAQNHTTDSLFRAMLEHQKLSEVTRAYVCSPYTGDIQADDATLEADIPQNFYRASQILIAHDAGDDLLANRDLAQSLAERARAGEDFEALVLEYNENVYMDTHNGYYFTTGEMLPEFEQTALSLEIGEVSDAVFSAEGYLVIKRLPQERDYIDSHFEELREVYRARIYNERVQAQADAFEIHYYDRFYDFQP